MIAQIFNATLEEVKAQGVDIEKIGGTAEPTATQWQALLLCEVNSRKRM